MSNDPFSFLRSLVPASGSGDLHTGGAVSPDSADTMDSDLFSGSEPVPAEPENTAQIEAGGPGSVDNISALAPVASAAPVAAPATIPGDVLATMQAALIDLDDRLKVVEVYLRQNGVL